MHIAMLFAQEKKALTGEEAQAYEDDAWRVFNRLAIAQNINVAMESPGKLFIEAISASLNMGSVMLKNMEGALEPRPGQIAVGWRNENHIYLDPGPSYMAVKEYYRRSGEAFTMHRNQTLQDLKSLDYLECGDEPTSVVWIGNGSRRVLVVKAENLIY